MKSRDEMKKALMKNLDIPEKPQLPVSYEDTKRSEINDDYELSRKTYRSLLDKHMLTYDIMLEVARDSEHPRAFEVLSKIMKDIADVTDKLMELQKKREQIDTGKVQDFEPGSTNTTTTNNVFVGSTTDLQKMLQDANEKLINPYDDK